MSLREASKDPLQESFEEPEISGKLASDELAVVDAEKPEYWFQGFGNDWLENFYELDSVAEQLPSGIEMYIPTQWGLLVLALLLLMFLGKVFIVARLERQLNTYRHEASELLVSVKLDLDQNQLQSLALVPEILSRCLLVFNERADLANLDVKQKVTYLNSMLPVKTNKKDNLIDEEDIHFLESIRFKKTAVDHDKRRANLVLSRVEYWLNEHKPERYRAST